jgi:CheY-like chemotaxis protein
MSTRTLSRPRIATIPCGLPPTNYADADVASRTVLLVEDDDQVLTLVSQTLTSLGHQVIVARDGQEALRVVRANPMIDYLFTDIVMPNGMNGMQLMQAARAERPGLRTLLTSVRSREEVRALGKIPYDVAFIPKPYSLTDIHAYLKWDRKNPRYSPSADHRWLGTPPSGDIDYNDNADSSELASTVFSEESCEWICWT